MTTQKPFSPKFNTQARQWDVVAADGEIVAMLTGGKSGQAHAERLALNYNNQAGL